MPFPELGIKDYISEKEYWEFIDWWNAGGGSGLSGRPGYDNKLLTDPTLYRKLNEWAYGKYSQFKFTDNANVSPEIRDYWDYASAYLDNESESVLQSYVSLRNLWNTIANTSDVTQLPGWVGFQNDKRQQLESNIQNQGMLYAKNIIKWVDPKTSITHYYTNATGNGLTEIPESLLNQYISGKSPAELEAEKADAAYKDWQMRRGDRQDALDATQWQQQFDFNRNKWFNELDQSNRQLSYQMQRDAADRELQRQQYIASVKAQPRNWVEAWYLENPNAGQMNPNGVSSTWNKLQTVRDSNAQLGTWDTAQQYTSNPMSKAYGQQPQGQVGQLWQNLLQSGIQQEKEAQQNFNNAIANRQPDYYQATPNAPKWLNEFVPTLTPGQPMTKAPITIASGQQWNRTPYSQREMVGGYVNWAGSLSGAPTYEDYQDYIEANINKQSNKAKFRPAWQG